MSEIPVLRATQDGKPVDSAIETIAEVLRAEEIAALPTDTIYGLHGLARSEKAIAAIDVAKGRPEGQPYLVLAADHEQIAELGVAADASVLEALGELWPAPLTAILPTREPFPAVRDRATVAVRIPALEWMLALLRKTGPLASTSLNQSGESPAFELPDQDRLKEIGVAIAVDHGASETQASTIVDFTQDDPRVVRQGPFRFTQKLWKTVWKSL